MIQTAALQATIVPHGEMVSGICTTDIAGNSHLSSAADNTTSFSFGQQIQGKRRIH